MARKPHLRSVAAASAASAVSSVSAALAAPGGARAPASPSAPTRTPCRALLGPRPLIDGEDGTNYDVILERISADVAPGHHAALLLDQAGWHLSGKLSVPDNITIVPLPPKCPELNPQENVWQFVRENWLSKPRELILH